MKHQTDIKNAIIPEPEAIHLTTWQSIKRKYMDVIVLLRIEDYYFSFDNDAYLLSSITGIPQIASTMLKTQSCFPIHQLDHFLHRLVKAGYRVAICDQLESP